MNQDQKYNPFLLSEDEKVGIIRYLPYNDVAVSQGIGISTR